MDERDNHLPCHIQLVYVRSMVKNCPALVLRYAIKDVRDEEWGQFIKEYLVLMAVCCGLVLRDKQWRQGAITCTAGS